MGALTTAPLFALLERALADGVFPGGALLVADGGEVVLRHAFGRRQLVPTPGPPATLDTVYDVASLTKVVCTTALVMRLIEAGRLALDTPAATYVPELAGAGGAKGRIQVRDLLAHGAGLAAWRPFHEQLLGVARPREEIVRLAALEPLEAPVGARSVYSDLGFILLGAVVERAGQARLDELGARAVFGPLGMAATQFVDLATPGAARPQPVAPTELCPRRGLLAGEVHDDNCHAAGGVLGHAGLFSTVEDLSRFVAALVASLAGRRPAGGFPPELVRTFFAPCGIPGSTRRLGWDGPSPGRGESQAGDLWPKSGVGHMGFTGCSIWIDLERTRWVILLTNRVHPTRANEQIKRVRPLVHDAIVTMLGGAHG